MNTQFTVDYFLDKFEKIPEDKWLVGDYRNDELTKFCAAGHCGGSPYRCTKEASDLADIFIAHKTKVAYVNDGDDKNYQQPTPKQRILAALRDIKKMQGSQNTVSKEPEVQASVATVDAQRTGSWPNKSSEFLSIIPIVDEVQDTVLEKVNN